MMLTRIFFRDSSFNIPRLLSSENIFRTGFFFFLDENAGASVKLNLLALSLTHYLKDWSNRVPYSWNPCCVRVRQENSMNLVVYRNIFVQWNLDESKKVQAKKEDNHFSALSVK